MDVAIQVDVLILGAGPAGIAAARTLQEHNERNHHHPSDNITFTVLEARNRVGGRAHTSAAMIPFTVTTTTTTETDDTAITDDNAITDQSAPLPIQLDHGAKWIHGSCPQNVMIQKLKEQKQKQGMNPKKKTKKPRGKNSALLRVVVPNDNNNEEPTKSMEASPEAERAAQTIVKHLQKAMEEEQRHSQRDSSRQDRTVLEWLRQEHNDCWPSTENDALALTRNQEQVFWKQLCQKLVALQPGHKSRTKPKKGNHTKKTHSENNNNNNNLFLDQVVALTLSKFHAFWECWEGAPLHQVSLLHGLDGTELPGGNAAVPGGYGGLIQSLAEPFLLADNKSIRLGHVVQAIQTTASRDDTTPKCVSVTCRLNDGSVQTFQAKSCIVTLPLGVLKDGVNSSLFQPPLPHNVIQTIQSMGVAVMNKIEMAFDQRWWGSQDVARLNIASALPNRSPTYHPYAFFIVEEVEHEHDSTSVNNNNSKGNDSNGSHVLVCYTTGEHAKDIEHKSNELITQECLEAMRQASFGQKHHHQISDIPNPTHVHVTRWYSDPYSRGSWSFFAKDSSPAMLSAAFGVPGDSPGECVTADRGLYFAGEHTCDGSIQGLDIGCVHGAWLSGETAARRVIRKLLQVD